MSIIEKLPFNPVCCHSYDDCIKSKKCLSKKLNSDSLCDNAVKYLIDKYNTLIKDKSSLYDDFKDMLDSYKDSKKEITELERKIHELDITIKELNREIEKYKIEINLLKKEKKNNIKDIGT